MIMSYKLLTFAELIDVYSISRSNQPEVFCKKGVLRNFARVA